MITRIVLFLACLLVSFSARAEEITLARAVELALGHAPAMKAAEAGRDASEQDYYIGLAGLLPRVDATGSHQLREQKTRYDELQNIFQPNLKYHDSTIALRVVQPLFDLERWAGYRQGEISAEAGEMRLRLERQRLMLETAQTYLEAVTAQSALRAARAREEAAERLALQAEAVFAAGVSAFNERLDADARRDLARAERLVAENSLDQAMERLASLTGDMAVKVSPPAIFSGLSGSLPDKSESWGAACGRRSALRASSAYSSAQPKRRRQRHGEAVCQSWKPLHHWKAVVPHRVNWEARKHIIRLLVFSWLFHYLQVAATGRG